jgi:HEAT repeat protein
MSDDRYGASRPLDVLNARGLTAKREYVRGLEQRRDPEAISLLVECLCDESWFLRDLAEEAFMRMGEDQAGVLLPLLEQGLWFTRTSAAKVLGRMGYRPAVPAMLRLCDDANETVGAAASEALVAMGHHGGAARIAHALHRLPPDLRRKRLEEFLVRDRALAERLERMMRNEELMSVEAADGLADDSELVRIGEEGVEWEVLTGPPPAKERPESAPGGHDASAGT